MSLSLIPPTALVGIISYGRMVGTTYLNFVITSSFVLRSSYMSWAVMVTLRAMSSRGLKRSLLNSSRSH